MNRCSSWCIMTTMTLWQDHGLTNHPLWVYLGPIRAQVLQFSQDCHIAAIHWWPLNSVSIFFSSPDADDWCNGWPVQQPSWNYPTFDQTKPKHATPLFLSFDLHHPKKGSVLTINYFPSHMAWSRVTFIFDSITNLSVYWPHMYNYVHVYYILCIISLHLYTRGNWTLPQKLQGISSIPLGISSIYLILSFYLCRFPSVSHCI